MVKMLKLTSLLFLFATCVFAQVVDPPFSGSGAPSGGGVGGASSLTTPGDVAVVDTSGTLTQIATTGTGLAVLQTSPSLITPALGTPSSGTATNITGLPVSTGISGLGSGVATFLATPSSANLATAITDETGSGALVFATSPKFTTSAISPNFHGTAVLFTNLATAFPSNGDSGYVSDGTVTSGSDDTCAGSGTGAWVVRLNGIYRCRQ